jgi:hypothetical protein
MNRLGQWASSRRAAGKLRHSQEWSLFRKALAQTRTYAEYGSGASTLFVDSLQTHDLVSVETDPLWADRLRPRLSRRARVIHIDLGPVGPWGRPDTYQHADKFTTYFEGAFLDNFEPDMILIDGRFRVACFLTCLLRAAAGTQIIWDDYGFRPHYHVVENLLKPSSVTTRQALFVVPESLPKTEIREMLDSFRLVMD